MHLLCTLLYTFILLFECFSQLNKCKNTFFSVYMTCGSLRETQVGLRMRNRAAVDRIVDG